MKIWILGDYIDTDAIMPAKYLNNNDPAYYSQFCLEQVDSDFPKKAKKGDVILAGQFFGCGSSRESAPNAIKYVGISCIFAESFSRIFFRNAINIGLPVVEVEEKTRSKIMQAEQIYLSENLDHVVVKEHQQKLKLETGYSEFIKEILQNGGLMSAYQKGVIFR